MEPLGRGLPAKMGEMILQHALSGSQDTASPLRLFLFPQRGKEQHFSY